MNDYELSAEAMNDLQAIWLFIARDNPTAADQLESDIYEACEFLAKNPRIGNKRTDLTQEPVLFWPVRANYLVVYQKAKGPLKIVRVLHASRDATELL